MKARNELKKKLKWDDETAEQKKNDKHEIASKLLLYTLLSCVFFKFLFQRNQGIVNFFFFFLKNKNSCHETMQIENSKMLDSD